MANLGRWAVVSTAAGRIEASTKDTARLGTSNNAIGVRVEAELLVRATSDARAALSGRARSPLWRR